MRPSYITAPHAPSHHLDEQRVGALTSRPRAVSTGRAPETGGHRRTKKNWVSPYNASSGGPRGRADPVRRVFFGFETLTGATSGFSFPLGRNHLLLLGYCGVSEELFSPDWASTPRELHEAGRDLVTGTQGSEPGKTAL